MSPLRDKLQILDRTPDKPVKEKRKSERLLHPKPAQNTQQVKLASIPHGRQEQKRASSKPEEAQSTHSLINNDISLTVTNGEQKMLVR